MVTDKADYPPGDTVWITGTGFASKESVTVQVTHVDTTVIGGAGHDPWTIKANNSGGFLTYWVVPYDDNGGETLKVTATGKTSGLVATTTFLDVNTILTFVSIPETVTVGDTFCITANLKENCGGDPDAPLEGRQILFFLTEANCGADVGQASPDSSLTDSLGNATGCLVIPDSLPPGSYGVRIKFRGEDKPNPCTTPNSACDTTKCVELSNSNECEGITAITNVCPELTLTAPSSAFVCNGDSVCIVLSATDGNSGDTLTLSKLSGVGTYPGKSGVSPLSDTFCFVPPSSGSYTFIFRVTDGTCNDDDTVTIVVTLNSPPSVTGPADKNVFVCSLPTTICVGPFTFSDPNNNIQSKTTNKGTLSGDSVCYTATTSGPDTIIVTVTDSCGAMDKDTVIVTKTVNSPPTVTAPDGAKFMCGPDSLKFQVCASDPDAGDTITLMLVSGPPASFPTKTGVTPQCDTLRTFISASGTYTWVFKVTNGCGAVDYDTAVWVITLNSPPTVTGPADKNVALCSLPTTICVGPFTFSDPNSNIQSKTTNKGTLSGDSVCYTATTSGPDTIIVTVTDSCGAMDKDTVIVTKSVNSPPTVMAPDSSKFLCASDTLKFTVTATDPDVGDTLTLEKISGPGTFPTVTGVSPLSGQLKHFVTAAGTYTYIFKVTDECGKTDIDTATWVVTINSPPTVTGPADKNVFVCSLPTTICVGPFTFSDPNNNIQSKTTNKGTLSGDSVCYTATTSGPDTIIVTVTDSCGAMDKDTVIVTKTVNSPPTVTAPDGAKFMCGPDSLKFQVCASDPDAGDTITLMLVSGPPASFPTKTGVTPQCDTLRTFISASGTYTWVFKVTNGCGAVDYDTAVWVITLNSPPTVTGPADKNVALCSLPTTICVGPFTFSDPNNNIQSKTTNKGTLSGDSVCYTATTSGPDTIIVTVTDSCGAMDKDTVIVTKSVNSPPQVTCSDKTLKLCAPDTIGIPVIGTDPDGASDVLNLTFVSGTTSILPGFGKSGPPTLNDTIYYMANNTKVDTFIVKITDACGTVDYDTCISNVTVNHLPVVTAPDGFITLNSCPQDTVIKFSVCATDPDAGDTLTLTKIFGPGIFSPVTGTSPVCGNFQYTATDTGTYVFIFEVANGCTTDVDTATWVVKCPLGPCIIVEIDSVRGNPGEVVYLPVKIFINDGESVGGFDFDIEYSTTELTALSVLRGDAIDDKDILDKYTWEHFTFRLEPSTVIHKYKIHVIGIAEMSDGHDGIPLGATPGFVELFKIKFVLANNELLRCLKTTVRFEWHDWECIENTLSDSTGNILYVSGDPNQYNFVDCPSDPKNDIRDCVEFRDGGINFRCLDELDPPQIGDVNLNGFPYEISDAVLFSSYFINGEAVFTINRDGQVAGTDINRDGFVLTISDLVYLVRIIQGDAVPLGKLSTETGLANIYYDGKSVSSSAELGAALFVFKGGEGITPEVKNLEYYSNATNGQLRILVVAMQKGSRIEAGTNLFSVKGNAELVEVKAADYSSNEVEITIVNRPTQATLPESYQLAQNYPNPFNPETRIDFALSEDSKVSLRIYNLKGELVKTLIEATLSAGVHTVVWNGTNENNQKVASGVYFYKLIADKFTATKKMILIK